MARTARQAPQSSPIAIFLLALRKLNGGIFSRPDLQRVGCAVDAEAANKDRRPRRKTCRQAGGRRPVKPVQHFAVVCARVWSGRSNSAPDRVRPGLSIAFCVSGAPHGYAEPSYLIVMPPSPRLTVLAFQSLRAYNFDARSANFPSASSAARRRLGRSLSRCVLRGVCFLSQAGWSRLARSGSRAGLLVGLGALGIERALLARMTLRSADPKPGVWRGAPSSWAGAIRPRPAPRIRRAADSPKSPCSACSTTAATSARRRRSRASRSSATSTISSSSRATRASIWSSSRCRSPPSSAFCRCCASSGCCRSTSGSPRTPTLRFRPRSYSYIGQVPVLDLFDKPIADWDVVIKLAFDKIVGALALIALSPVLLATRDRGQTRFARAGAVPAAALRLQQRTDRGLQVPLDVCRHSSMRAPRSWSRATIRA